MATRITNRLGLPDGIVAAIENDPYEPGDGDISVTKLISPPFQRRLRMATETVEDVSDRVWALIGQSVHAMLERAYRGKGLVEQRLYHSCEGWRVSGQFDVIEDGCLQDWKVTSVWSVIGETKKEWEQQLNLLRLLAHHNDIEVTSLRIIAILRDWSRNRTFDPAYPQAQVVPIEIPMWSLDRAEQYLVERVKAHQNEQPPLCTDEERWRRPDVFAVMKEGRKTAVKLHDSMSSAERHVLDLGSNHRVDVRPGGFVRCEGYCDVAHACPAMKTAVGF